MKTKHIQYQTQGTCSQLIDVTADENDVMRIVKEMQPRIVSQTYDNTCEIKLSIRKSEAEQLRNRLSKLSFE